MCMMLVLNSAILVVKLIVVIAAHTAAFSYEYLHFSKTSLDEPLDVHLCSYIHEQHRVTRRHT